VRLCRLHDHIRRSREEDPAHALNRVGSHVLELAPEARHVADCAFRFISNVFQSEHDARRAHVPALGQRRAAQRRSLDRARLAHLLGHPRRRRQVRLRVELALDHRHLVARRGRRRRLRHLHYDLGRVVRNQWFFTGVALADNVPAGVRFIVSTYCAVEIADICNEGATYGLITIISNLASPVASVSSTSSSTRTLRCPRTTSRPTRPRSGGRSRTAT